jgi:hypothetical protein
LFFKRFFNVKLVYTIQVIGPWLWGKKLKGPSEVNDPPVHGIKNAVPRFDYSMRLKKMIPFPQQFAFIHRLPKYLVDAGHVIC